MGKPRVLLIICFETAYEYITDKKENKIFLIYKEIQKAVAKSYITKILF